MSISDLFHPNFYDLFADSITVNEIVTSGDLEVMGNLTVDGTSHLIGVVTTDSDVNVGGNLLVTGTSIFQDLVSINNGVNVQGNISNTTGNLTLSAGSPNALITARDINISTPRIDELFIPISQFFLFNVIGAATLERETNTNMEIIQCLGGSSVETITNLNQPSDARFASNKGFKLTGCRLVYNVLAAVTVSISFQILQTTISNGSPVAGSTNLITMGNTPVLVGNFAQLSLSVPPQLYLGPNLVYTLRLIIDASDPGDLINFYGAILEFDRNDL